MIVIGGRDICLEDFQKILFEEARIEHDDQVLIDTEKCFSFLKDFSKDKIIYGINTGLGPMSQYKVREEDRLDLQYNLIRSHAAGAGKPMEEIHVKALMVARLNTLMKGYSGIHPSVVKLLRDFINNNITPVIPQHGGVVTSGDLVQLAHLALALIGEGEVTVSGKMQDTAESLQKAGLEPIKMHIREALSLINGTSAMSGIGIVNVILARQLLDWTVAASALINEVMSIHLLTLIQAIAYLKIEDKMSTFTKGLYQKLRSEVPVFSEDHVMAPDIRKMKDYINQNKLTF